jgi:hypothetical protein
MRIQSFHCRISLSFLPFYLYFSLRPCNSSFFYEEKSLWWTQSTHAKYNYKVGAHRTRISKVSLFLSKSVMYCTLLLSFSLSLLRVVCVHSRSRIICSHFQSLICWSLCVLTFWFIFVRLIWTNSFFVLSFRKKVSSVYSLFYQPIIFGSTFFLSVCKCAYFPSCEFLMMFKKE